MKRVSCPLFLWLIALLMLYAGCFLAVPCSALEPHEIIVLANRNASQSVGLAKYYMEKRGVPKNNLLQLWITDKELCERDDYEKKIVTPVRKFLKEKDPMGVIRCILAMYGLPLKLAPPKMTKEENSELKRLEKRKVDLIGRLKDMQADEKEQIKILKSELKGVKKIISVLKKEDERSSLDSEIALVLEQNYKLSGWVPNPYFLGYRGKKIKNMPRKALMVSRLDGPSAEIVRRIIDDSISTEKTGLKGTAYFDARYTRPKVESKARSRSGPTLYDHSLYLAADHVEKTGRMPVVVNSKSELFQPGECPGAALYCGWYSLARYVDAFEWQPGSVGYHIASNECATLKRKKSQVWCKMMLEKGVAATLGPVNEPYVQAFPIPEIFFGLLVEGRLTLAECYALSQPFWSWQMVLIGDPLYRPFKH
jgi:uncharacterized protein (TIGR03790 family)